MKPVVTFGEIMLRLTPKDHLRFLQANEFEVSFGGAEANVAVSLAQLGRASRFVTTIPTHDVGEQCVQKLRGLGVDVGSIRRKGDRLGIYFVEKGASQRGSAVIYDRAGSAFAESSQRDFDWHALLADAGWFHFTGITPALSEGCRDACMKALEVCRELRIPVSCDLNYRKKLWSREQAGRVMGELLPLTSYCIANEEDAADVFGIHSENTDVTAGQLDHARYQSVAEQLTQRFGLQGVAITLRESYSASHNGWSGLLYTKGKAYFSRRYEMHIVDRVGGGDAFGAGLIDALSSGADPSQAIEFAVASSCLKHSIQGDFNYVRREEVEKLLAGDGSGRVQR